MSIAQTDRRASEEAAMEPNALNTKSGSLKRPREDVETQAAKKPKLYPEIVEIHSSESETSASSGSKASTSTEESLDSEKRKEKPKKATKKPKPPAKKPPKGNEKDSKNSKPSKKPANETKKKPKKKKSSFWNSEGSGPTLQPNNPNPLDIEHDESVTVAADPNQDQDQEQLQDLVLSANPDAKVPLAVNNRLRAYQREGAHFLYKLYKENTGGILGDEMGLGKTIQAIAFLIAILGKDPSQKNPFGKCKWYRKPKTTNGQPETAEPPKATEKQPPKPKAKPKPKPAAKKANPAPKKAKPKPKPPPVIPISLARRVSSQKRSPFLSKRCNLEKWDSSSSYTSDSSTSSTDSSGSSTTSSSSSTSSSGSSTSSTSTSTSSLDSSTSSSTSTSSSSSLSSSSLSSSSSSSSSMSTSSSSPMSTSSSSLSSSSSTSSDDSTSSSKSSSNKNEPVQEAQSVPCAPALLVVPLTVMHQWKNEIKRWTALTEKKLTVGVYWGSDKKRRGGPLPAKPYLFRLFTVPLITVDALTATKGGFNDILLTTYETLRIDLEQLNLPWSVTIFDEIHKIKGIKSKTRAACVQLKTTVRIGLTGTIMQNNFEELWALLDFVRPNSFGPLTQFKRFYIQPIKLGQRKNAEEEDIVIGRKATVHLNKKIKEMVLRRDKSVISDLLPGKRDSIVFCPLTDLQLKVYQRVLDLPEIKALTNFAADRALKQQQKEKEKEAERKEKQSEKEADKETANGADTETKTDKEETEEKETESSVQNHNEPSPLEIIDGDDAAPMSTEAPGDETTEAPGDETTEAPGDETTVAEDEVSEAPLEVPQTLSPADLKKTVFPAITTLLKIANHVQLLQPRSPKKEIFEKEKAFFERALGPDQEKILQSIQNHDIEICGKLKALQNLLAMWFKAGRKVLLFSYATKMLDILEAFVKKQSYPFRRLDGKTAMDDRGRVIDQFNNNKTGEFLFLISTKAGGLGINLASASIVVVFDTSWNVSHDLQAQDRAYRIGQTRFTEVYRLVSIGTIEEMVYNRQVYKQQLASIGLQGSHERRYFAGVAGVKGQEGEIFGLLNLLKHNANSVTNELLQNAKQEEAEYFIQTTEQTEQQDTEQKEFEIQAVFDDIPDEEYDPNYDPTNIIDLKELKVKNRQQQFDNHVRSLLHQSGVQHHFDHSGILGDRVFEQKRLESAQLNWAKRQELVAHEAEIHRMTQLAPTGLNRLQTENLNWFPSYPNYFIFPGNGHYLPRAPQQDSHPIVITNPNLGRPQEPLSQADLEFLRKQDPLRRPYTFQAPGASPTKQTDSSSTITPQYAFLGQPFHSFSPNFHRDGTFFHTGPSSLPSSFSAGKKT